MIEIFLHIGTHKTGTSTIQKSLNVNRDILLNYSVLYPNSGRTPSDPHAQHLLASSIARQNNINIENEWSLLIKEINLSSARKVIISSEGFCLNTASEIKNLAKILLNYKCKIILYLRNPQTLMLSRYKQQIKNQKTSESPRQFFTNRISYFDYENLVNRWGNFFGNENIILRSFENTSKFDSLTDDFYNVINISTKSLKNVPFVNVSPDDKASKLLLWLNKNPFVNSTYFGKKLRSHLKRMTTMGKLASNMNSLFFPSPLVPKTDLKWLNEQFKPLMLKFHKSLNKEHQLTFNYLRNFS